jgi:HAD superfamily hydrolase (TIGR01509 family)
VIRTPSIVRDSEFQFLEPRAIVFDMDGVIIDSHPAHRKAWRLFLRTLGKQVSEEELAFILDGHKRNDILRHFLGDLPEAELLGYGELKDDYFRRASLSVKPLRGVLRFMQQLRSEGILLGLATSASPSRTFSTLERMNVRHYFSTVITAADVSHGKPDPAVYRLACDRLNVDYGNVLAFEDAVSGIQAAREAGLKCAGVARSPRAEELLLAGAEFVIENFAGLSLGILKSKLVPTYRLSSPESAAP